MSMSVEAIQKFFRDADPGGLGEHVLIFGPARLYRQEAERAYSLFPFVGLEVALETALDEAFNIVFNLNGDEVTRRRPSIDFRKVLSKYPDHILELEAVCQVSAGH